VLGISFFLKYTVN